MWFALVMLALLVLGVLAFAWMWIASRLQELEERKLCVRLAGIDRFLRWCDLEAQLELGAGTLIYEIHAPLGPHLVWWTEHDLLTAAPVPLPTSFRERYPDDPLRLLEDYTTFCCKHYVDIDTGSAMLCECTITERELAARFPETRILMLFTFAGTSTRLYQGDYQMVVFGRRL